MSPAEPKARLMKSTPMAGLYSVGSQTRKLDLILGGLAHGDALLRIT